MKYFYLFFLILCGCFIGSCSSLFNNEQAPVLGEEFEIKYNQKLIFDGTDTVIEFTDVKDFRCNISTVDCAWSGDATITLKINSEFQEFNYYSPEINYEWQNDTVSAISGFNVTISAITPEHRETENEPKENYKVVLKVTPK